MPKKRERERRGMVQVILEKGLFFFVFMNGDAWHAARTNAPDIGGPCDQVKLEKLDNQKWS